MKKLLRLFAVPLLFVSLTTFSAAESDTVAPNENLVVEGIPPIPASLATTVERYNNFRWAHLYDWNPVRREILITTRFADTNQLHSVTMPGGARTQLTFFPEPVSSALYQPTRGNFFVFSKDVGGGEFFQFYRYDIDKGDITLLTDGKSIYLEEAPNRIIDLLKNARQPMFLVCVSDQVKRLGAARERKPNKSETSAARKSRAL